MAPCTVRTLAACLPPPPPLTAAAACRRTPCRPLRAMAADAGQAEWLDAQPYLERVCAGMAVGELLHGPSFSLFESTTAIEIGDPKMDMGMHRRCWPAVGGM